MKKILQVCLLGVLLLGASGCSGGMDGEKILKNIDEKGYSIDVSYSSQKDYYDSDGKCYDYSGKETTCGRLVSDLEDMPVLRIKKSADEYIVIGQGDKGLYLNGMTSKAVYTSIADEESVNLMTGKTSEWCYYFYKGGEDADNKCDETRKSDADKVKEANNELLEEIGLSSENAESFLTWYQENKLPDLVKILKERKASQKELTNNEIVKILKDNEYSVSKTDTGETMVLANDGYKWYATMKKDDGTLNGVMHYYKIFSDSSSTNKMTIAYMFDTSSYLSLNTGSTCVYDVTTKKVDDSKTCSQDQIDDAESMQFSFEYTIEKMGLTQDEFLNFMKTYK